MRRQSSNRRWDKNPEALPGPRARQSADHFHPHRSDAGALHADDAGGAVGQIDRPVVHEGTAVVDPHRNRLAVLEIGDPHLGPERQRPVRGGERIRADPLTGCRAAGIEARHSARSALEAGNVFARRGGGAGGLITAVMVCVAARRPGRGRTAPRKPEHEQNRNRARQRPHRRIPRFARAILRTVVSKMGRQPEAYRSLSRSGCKASANPHNQQEFCCTTAAAGALGQRPLGSNSGGGGSICWSRRWSSWSLIGVVGVRLASPAVSPTWTSWGNSSTAASTVHCAIRNGSSARRMSRNSRVWRNVQWTVLAAVLLFP